MSHSPSAKGEPSCKPDYLLQEMRRYVTFNAGRCITIIIAGISQPKGWRMLMASTFIERQMENAVQDLLDDKAIRIVRGVRKMAAKRSLRAPLLRAQN